MSSKGKFSILLIIVIIVSVILGIIFLKHNEKKDFQASLKSLKPISYKKNIEIPLGDSIPKAKDYSESFKNNILWLNEDFPKKAEKVGTYRGSILHHYRLYFVTLTIVDKNPPIIANVKDITVYEGDTIDLKKQVSVKDDSNLDVTLEVKGEYSFQKEGVYSLFYEATDSFGNKSSAPFKLTVKKKQVIKPKPSTSEKPNPSSLGKSSKGYDIVKSNGAYYIKGILVANKTYALSSTYAPGGLTKETNEAFLNMQKEAAKEGIKLTIISGYRSYTKQQSIYNRYVKRDGKKEADRYSARPGHSEHQTGLAFDVNSLDQSFGNTKAGIWLSENCYKYGFILRYPKGKESITGYMYEPWHFRYIGSDAKNLYNKGNWITLEEYLGVESFYAS